MSGLLELLLEQLLTSPFAYLYYRLNSGIVASTLLIIIIAFHQDQTRCVPSFVFLFANV